MIHEETLALGPIAARAIKEVLATQLRLIACESKLVELPAGGSEQSLVGSVELAGSRISGSVQLQLTEGFVDVAAGLLLGRSAADTEEAADITGELCNMLGGRVGVDLAVPGYSCILSTPKVSRGSRLKLESASQAQICRNDWTCEGHFAHSEVADHF